MTQSVSALTQHPDFRPWYREPWVWFLIALPTMSIVGCAITIWLALTHPDFVVIDEHEYRQIESGLRVGAETEATGAGQGNGDG
jgi:hypothetical protein